ncbi:translation initiation factor eif-2b subunit epsilon [Anaeramoeba flamelloides]|uniref:Translation initiation factor eif-2b subunit epsilon n=1 Tax=Anaeramoeba flamelloides TaxID=1746091 RepID=A0AAV7ZEB7_9EUKA|nr:translation initiation factor eif-2b subunit epsilon [Anaeramoeba flamelloides]
MIMMMKNVDENERKKKLKEFDHKSILGENSKGFIYDNKGIYQRKINEKKQQEAKEIESYSTSSSEEYSDSEYYSDRQNEVNNSPNSNDSLESNSDIEKDKQNDFMPKVFRNFENGIEDEYDEYEKQIEIIFRKCLDKNYEIEFLVSEIRTTGIAYRMTDMGSVVLKLILKIANEHSSQTDSNTSNSSLEVSKDAKINFFKKANSLIDQYFELPRNLLKSHNP